MTPFSFNLSGHMRRSAAYVGFTFVFLLMFAGPLNAHNVVIFAWVDGNRVYTESKFSGGRKAKNATVEVYDDEGNKLLEGKTDENGEFDFKIPKRTALKVVLVAGMGHRGEWIVPLDEIAPDMSVQPKPDKPAETPSPAVGETPPQTVPSGPSAEEIQAAVEKALDKKLKPIIKLMAESRQQGPSLSEIFGGIGYIAGMVGIGAYFSARKKKNKA